MNKRQLFNRAQYIYKNVPVYYNLAKELGIDPDKAKEFEDFSIVNKNYMLKWGSGCISPEHTMEYLQGKLISCRTSGSTGQYLEILWDETDYKKSLIELWMKRVKYYNIYPHNRLTYFFTENGQDGLFISMEHELGVCKNLLTDKGIETVYDKILQWNPEWMLLQPSSAAILCSYVNSHHVRKPEALRYIEFSGELLADEVRRMTEDTFGCAVADQYGANEVGSIAYECPYGNMHVMQSNVHVEIADENGNLIETCGQDGRIILTSLTNRAMPFVRYDIGDRGCIYKNTCRCGSNKPVIKLASGRANDYIEFSEEERAGSYLFVRILDKVNALTQGAVRQYYIEQRDYDVFYIKICRDDETEPEYIQEKFLECIDEPRLKNAEYQFEFTDELFQVQGNGKYIYFKNRIRK